MTKLLLTVIVVAMYSLVFATGPSWIVSTIKPVSVNEKGEILCRTRYEENRMGAHWPMVVSYGYCVLHNGAITEIPISMEFDPSKFPDDEINEFFKEKIQLDSVFNNCSDTSYLEPLKSHVNEALLEYGFKPCNVNKYKVDKIFTKEQFEKNKKIKIADIPQKALRGATGTDYPEKPQNIKIHVLYDFGKLVIVENKGGEEGITGADFDYYNPWTDENGNKINIGFDYFAITGVFFIK